MKVGDFVEFNKDEYNDRLGVYGLVIATGVLYNGKEAEPSLVNVLWESGEFEDVFEDELVVVSEGR